MDDFKKTLKYLVEVEKLGGEILADRRTVVFLDARRNENREALRSITHHRPGDKKWWISVGGNLVKCSAEAAKKLLENEQSNLDAELNKIRSELKVKVNRLRDLEFKPPVPGLMLAPLSMEENKAFSGKLY